MFNYTIRFANIPKEGLRNSIELKEDDPQHAEWMLRFLYAHDYYVDYCDGKPPIVAHARMYAIADKYDIPILKDLAIAKFAPSLKDTQAVDIPSFTAAIEVIYTSTLDTDRGLRDCLIPTLKDRMRHLRDDEHSMKLVKSLGEGDFAVDVIDAWTVLKELVLKGSITWYCKCGNLGTGTLSTCTECGSKQLRHGFS
ncbi:hypothetical protein MMC28_000992 [Mycoblastus sanguinarius]|nr:hypothetical protein [Mycoblastus sanguinarius]